MKERAKHCLWLTIVILLALVVAGTAILFVKPALQLREEADRANPRYVASLRLNWIPDPTFTGAYISKSRKFWAKRRLNVDIRPGGMNLDPVRLVAEGTDTFGITGADRLLQARAEGLPVVAISLELRDNPVGWIVREEANIHGFKDLKDKKVGQKFGSETEAILEATLGLVGMSKDELTIIPVQFSVQPFLDRQVDAFPVYVNEEPFTVRSKNVEVRVLYPSEAGLRIYGNVVIASESTVKDKPGCARDFVAGLLDGWAAATSGRPADISQELVKVEPDMAKVPTEEVLAATLGLVRGRREDAGPIGWMKLNEWQETHKMLSTYAGLKKHMDIEASFTNLFVEEYYRKDKP